MKSKEIVVTILTAVFGIASSYALSAYAKQGPVIGASLICLIGGLFFGNYAGVNNSGSFAGMTSSTVIPSIEYTLLTGLVLWIVFIKSFLGYGGRQGVIAFISVNISSLILYSINPISYFNPDAYSVINATYVVLVITFSTFGTVSTIILRERVVQKVFRQNDSVIGAAIVGLLAGFLIPSFPMPYCSTLPAVVAVGSYAGMSSKKNLKKYIDFLIVGMLTGIMFILLLPVSIGCGGKLGTGAFLSINIWKTIKKTLKC